MQIVTTLIQSDLNRVPEEIRRIESAGYDGVLTQENRHDPFLPLGVAAVNSEKLLLGTGVAIAFPRSPMLTANLAWDLQVASRGRFVLGIGPQVKGHNERRFSVKWTPPAPRIREYVLSLRAIWKAWKTGGELAFQGVPPDLGNPVVGGWHAARIRELLVDRCIHRMTLDVANRIDIVSHFGHERGVTLQPTRVERLGCQSR